MTPSRTCEIVGGSGVTPSVTAPGDNGIVFANHAFLYFIIF